jgi:hypothetical protein
MPSGDRAAACRRLLDLNRFDTGDMRALRDAAAEAVGHDLRAGHWRDLADGAWESGWTGALLLLAGILLRGDDPSPRMQDYDADMAADRNDSLEALTPASPGRWGSAAESAYAGRQRTRIAASAFERGWRDAMQAASKVI